MMKEIICELSEHEVRTIWAALQGLKDLFTTNISNLQVGTKDWFEAVDAYHAITETADRFTELRENFQ